MSLVSKMANFETKLDEIRIRNIHKMNIPFLIWPILLTFAKWGNAKGALHRQSACILGKNLGACPKTRAL